MIILSDIDKGIAPIMEGITLHFCEIGDGKVPSLFVGKRASTAVCTVLCSICVENYWNELSDSKKMM